jgi:hypothetical protein
MVISNAVAIDASALAGSLVISGNANSRVFQIMPAGAVTLNSLTLASGSISNDSGGAILNSGQLTALIPANCMGFFSRVFAAKSCKDCIACDILSGR